MRIFVLACGLALMFAPGTSASAQSLGDVARKEQARRKTIKTPSKIYTNAHVRSEPGDPAPTEPPAGDKAKLPAADTAATTPAAKPDAGKGEAYWRERITEARANLERRKIFQEALQSRINALTADFAARDDPAQRALITTDRQRALAELERVKQEVEQQTKMIADIEEEARRAGVPAGWLR